MKLSLGQKIAGLLLCPLLAFLVATMFLLKSAWDDRTAARMIGYNSAFFQAVSSVTHESQKERGRSVLFLNGKVSRDELVAQRTSLDEKLRVFSDAMKFAQVEPKFTDLASRQVEAIQQARRDVDRTIPPAQAAAQYTAVHARLIEVQVALTQAAHLDGIETRLLSLTMFEGAKESVGRLRAALANLIAADQPLKPSEFSLIQSLMASAISGLESPALIVSSEAHQEIKQMTSSSDWNNVTRAFDRVLKGASTGGFGEDPKAFWDSITASINMLGATLADELKRVGERVDEVNALATKRFVVTLMIALALSAALIVAAWKFVRSLSRELEGLASKLSSDAEQVSVASRQISSAGAELSSSVTEQAAALQQTVASLHQISGMVAKNAENAEQSQGAVKASLDAANEGKGAIGAMIQSMEEIDASNKDFLQHVAKSNKEVSEIANLITEIGSKTKVINDIVFQTKLLSFNASVEAARAGEQGKGFAVVAEEVGKLAQMSGGAAKEITDMLESSISKVEITVREMQSKLESLSKSGQEKVEQGAATARRCAETLERIAVSVERVTRLVSEISDACREQAKGTDEINRAMNQLDQVTQNNASATQQSAVAAEQLTLLAGTLNSMVQKLFETVQGERAS